ncbi:MAG: Rrf2 family transcriptional regulator [Bryobacteraceae bacterium]|nr:Rrf2 family transcriptional regulator [Bryobacteraceae bacterium]
MNLSTRFTVALHILTLLASSGEEPLTSEYIAGSVNTNPVVVRRLLGLLRKKGLVTSQPGNGGGWRLVKDPGAMTLLDVRRAVNEGSPFSMHTNEPHPACPVGRNIQAALKGVYARAERAMEAELAESTIEYLVRSVRGRARG